MKKLTFLITIIFSAFGNADDIENHDFLYGYLVGKYIVVGKELNGESTYSGKVIFERDEDHLKVTRIINNKTLVGDGYIEHALGRDQANVLRVRFEKNEEKIEATYLWRNDLDNYARITGYLYHPNIKTNTPGIEALFIDHEK